MATKRSYYDGLLQTFKTLFDAQIEMYFSLEAELETTLAELEIEKEISARWKCRKLALDEGGLDAVLALVEAENAPDSSAIQMFIEEVSSAPTGDPAPGETVEALDPIKATSSNTSSLEQDTERPSPAPANTPPQDL